VGIQYTGLVFPPLMSSLPPWMLWDLRKTASRENPFINGHISGEGAGDRIKNRTSPERAAYNFLRNKLPVHGVGLSLQTVTSILPCMQIYTSRQVDVTRRGKLLVRQKAMIPLVAGVF
jgi:hypothetical protein